MTKLHPVDIEDGKGYGVIVNNVEPTKDEWSDKIADITSPLSISLKLTGEERTRLDRLVEDNRTTIDDYISSVVKASLEERVGKATIFAPSRVNGTSTKKVTAPSNLAWRGH